MDILDPCPLMLISLRSPYPTDPMIPIHLPSLGFIPMLDFLGSHPLIPVLPHTILSFPFISRITLGSYGSRTSPMNLPALLVDAPACTATHPAGAMRTSSWSSSVHPNPPTESSRILSYVSDSPRFTWISMGSHPTWLSRSFSYSSYSLMLMTPTQPRHWTRRNQGSSGFTSTSLRSIPVHPRVPRMSDLFARLTRPSVRPGSPGPAGDPINSLIRPCYIPADSSPHPQFART
ncbi:hypothetical protein R3P38DRAFT_3295429 [Favolaschia claudopus]|uniref:Uncharacterized protein n=1 Tax=Favolaschia claudopus TaxID=2862362 RepID=A0AAV9ZBQ7_9AGAR